MIQILDNNSYSFKIPFDENIKNLLDSFFTVINIEFDPEANENVGVEKVITEYDENYIYIPISLAEKVCDYLSKFDSIMADIHFDDKPELVTPEKYEERFSQRENQLEFFNSIKSKTRGVVQLPTGFGKTEIIIGLVDSYVEDDKNILIVAPLSSICEEIMMRLTDRGVHNLDKVRVINPVGHVNSNRYSDPDWISWMNNVGMIIIDESENVNDSLKALFDNQFTSYKYCYGMSASADKFKGKKLEVENNLKEFSEITYQVIKYIGTSLVYEKPKLELTLNIVQGTFGSKRLPFRNQFMDFNMSLKNILEHENLKKCLDIIVHKKNDILFIPIKTIKYGQNVQRFINEIDPSLNVALWNSGGIFGVEGITDYESLKKNADRVDVIIATRIAFLGIDIPRISDVLLVEGTQCNTIMQPIGRAFRNSNPSVWLIDEVYENKNRIYKMCYYKRLGIIRRNYKIKETNKFSIL